MDPTSAIAVERAECDTKQDSSDLRTPTPKDSQHAGDLKDSKIDSNQELKPSTDIANTHNTTCFACGNQFSVYSQASFMYADHEFCSEDCRSKQINLDVKMEFTASLTRHHKPQVIDQCSRLKHRAVYHPAQIMSFDGTYLMREIGIRTILGKMDVGYERPDLVDMVSAGLLKWRGFKSPDICVLPVLMLFKTPSTLEIMTCNGDEDMPGPLDDVGPAIHVAPVILLRGKKKFNRSNSLKTQLEKYDRMSGQYLTTKRFKKIAVKTVNRDHSSYQMCRRRTPGGGSSGHTEHGPHESPCRGVFGNPFTCVVS